MTIGLDLDNTICNTSAKLNEYAKDYALANNISVDKVFSDTYTKLDFINQYLEKAFLNAEVKENASLIINKLHENNTIYIVTARSKLYLPHIKKLIKNYLKANNINVDKIIIDGKDKVDACLLNHIDIMIDDSLYNYEALVNKHVKALLYDEDNNYPTIKNKVSSWQDIAKYFHL